MGCVCVKPKPSQLLNWIMECQAVFEKLMWLLVDESVLKHPSPDKTFVIEAGASDVAVGAVLLQRNAEGKLQPCTYTSHKFTDTERQGRRRSMQYGGRY